MPKMSKNEVSALWRLRRQRREALAAYKGFDVRAGFVECYYACYKALYRRKATNMPDKALRLYMRYCRIAIALETALKRHAFPPERLARIRLLRDRAWGAYRATDRNGPRAA